MSKPIQYWLRGEAWSYKRYWLRGGSWHSLSCICHVAYRATRTADTRYSYDGFRVVRGGGK